MRARMWPAVLALVGLAGCDDRREASGDATPATDGGASAPTATPASDVRLQAAARDMVSFLRGDLAFDSLAVADTVELRTAPEGGGAVRRLSRDALRDRGAWRAGDPRRHEVSFLPPAGYSVDSILVGRHVNCHAQDLATRAPDLATRPHVGVRLQPPGAESCLQSWNVTFVFDTTGGSVRLIAAVYDQFEW